MVASKVVGSKTADRVSTGSEGSREVNLLGTLVAQQVQLQHAKRVLQGRAFQSDLLGEGWEEEIMWDDTDAARQQQQRAHVIWDLNDQHMVFWSDQPEAFEAALVQRNPIQVGEGCYMAEKNSSLSLLYCWLLSMVLWQLPQGIASYNCKC